MFLKNINGFINWELKEYSDLNHNLLNKKLARLTEMVSLINTLRGNVNLKYMAISLGEIKYTAKLFQHPKYLLPPQRTSSHMDMKNK